MYSRTVALDDVDVLVHGVGRALIPLGPRETRWLAGRMSKLSLRSGRRKFQPRCRWRIRECALYCVATRDAADAGIDRVGEREIDDAGLAAEIDRRLGAPVGQFHQPRAAPAGQHIGHGVARQRRGSSVSLPSHPPNSCLVPGTYSSMIVANAAAGQAAAARALAALAHAATASTRPRFPLSGTAIPDGIGVHAFAPVARHSGIGTR